MWDWHIHRAEAARPVSQNSDIFKSHGAKGRVPVFHKYPLSHKHYVIQTTSTCSQKRAERGLKGPGSWNSAPSWLDPGGHRGHREHTELNCAVTRVTRTDKVVRTSDIPETSASPRSSCSPEFQMAPRKLETAGSKRPFPFPKKDAAGMLAAQHHHADPNSWPLPRLRVSGHSAWLTPEVTLNSACAFKLYGKRWEPRSLLL